LAIIFERVATGKVIRDCSRETAHTTSKIKWSTPTHCGLCFLALCSVQRKVESIKASPAFTWSVYFPSLLSVERKWQQ